MAKACKRTSGCRKAAARLLREAARKTAALGLSAVLACGLLPAAALAQEPDADKGGCEASRCIIVQSADAEGLAGEPVVAAFGDSYLLSYGSEAAAERASSRLARSCSLAAADGAMGAATNDAADADPPAYAEGADPFTLAGSIVEERESENRAREKAVEDAQAAEEAARVARVAADEARDAAADAQERAQAAQEAADAAAQELEAEHAVDTPEADDTDEGQEPQPPGDAASVVVDEASEAAHEAADGESPPEQVKPEADGEEWDDTRAEEAEVLAEQARSAREEAEKLAQAAQDAQAQAQAAESAAKEAQAAAEAAEAEAEAEEERTATIAVIDSGAPAEGADEAYDLTGLGAADGSGHATAVVARIRENAPDARIISIRVLDDENRGTIAATYAGIMLATELGSDVVNLSLSAPAADGQDAISAAIADAAATGALPVAAAGNDGADASGYTPANAPDAITVGACHSDGEPLESSNWGPCVDLYAVADSTSLAAATASGWLAACDAQDREAALRMEIGYGTFFPNDRNATPDADADGDTGAHDSEGAPAKPGAEAGSTGKQDAAAQQDGDKAAENEKEGAPAEDDERSVSAAGQAISAVKATEVRGVLDNGHSPDRTASAVGENQVRFEKGGQLPLKDATISYSGFKRKPSLATRNGCSLGEGAPYKRLGIWLPWDDAYYSSKGKSVPVPGKITMKWKGIATDMEGERLDLVLALDNIKVACSDSAAKKANSFSLLCNWESAQAAEGVLRASVACEYNPKWGKDQNPKVCAMFDLTASLYKHGSTSHTASKYIMRIQDLDQPDRHKSSKSWSGDYVERIELLSGFDGTVWTQESIPATESAGGESWTNPSKARGASALNIVKSDGDIRASDKLWGDNHSSYYRTGAVVRTAGGRAFKFRWAASAAETCLFQDYDGVIIRDRNDGERTTGANRTDRAIITKTVDNYGLVTNREDVAYDAGVAEAQGGKRTSTKFRRTDEPWKGKATYHFSAKAGYRVSKVTLTSWITKPTEAKAKSASYTSGAKLKSLSFSGGASNTLTRTDRNYDIVVRTAKVADATASLKARKALSGRELAANAFSIGLYKEKSASAEPLQVKKNDASGNVSFDALSFAYSDSESYPRTYTYYLHEVAGTDAKVKYDGTWWRADVAVSYDGGFRPSAKVTYTNLATNATAATPTFNNAYTPASASATISAAKRFQDETGAVLGQRTGMFKLGVYKVKSATQENLLKTLASTAAGTFSYQVSVRPDDPAETIYWLHEIPGSDPSIAYDGAWYQAVVSKSYDAATGALGATVAYRDADGRALLSAPTFVNERGNPPNDPYLAPAVWTPQVAKTLVGGSLEGGEFAFALKLGGQTVQTAVNDADGTVAFDPIEFGEADAHKTFHYTIEEVAGDIPGVAYDGRWWSADVSVFPMAASGRIERTCVYAVHGADEARPEAATTADLEQLAATPAAASSAHALTVRYHAHGAQTDHGTPVADEPLAEDAWAYGPGARDGLRDYTADGDSFLLLRAGYKPTGWWTFTAGGASYRVNESEEDVSAQQLAAWAGVDLSQRDAAIDLYAEWVPDASYVEDISSRPYGVGAAPDPHGYSFGPATWFENEQRSFVGARVKKVDAATGSALAGAVFEIAPAATGAAVHDEEGQALPGSVTVTSGDDGIAATHPAALETGRAYKVREVSPPEGYAISDVSWHAFIAGDGGTAAQYADLGTWADAPLSAKASIAVRKVNVLADGTGHVLPLAVPEDGFAFELREGAPDGPAVAAVTVPASADGISEAAFGDIEYGYRDVGEHTYWIVEKGRDEPGADWAEPRRVVVTVAVETGQPDGDGNEGVTTSKLVATVTEGAAS